MAARSRWVFLAYRLPREPSTPRIALWRGLRRLGAVQVLDGLVALPLDSRNRERLEWLAEGVEEAGGEASIWLAEAASSTEDRALARRLSEAIAAEYRELIDAAHAAREESESRRRRTLGRLRRELGRIRRRDYVPPPEREEAQAAVDELSRELEETPA